MAKITNKGMLRDREYVRPKKILSDNTKVDKEMEGYYGASLRFMSGHIFIDGKRKTTCPKSSEGCRSVCLATSGHGAFNDAVHNAEYQRTRAYYEDREWFFGQLYKELSAKYRKAKKMGRELAVRLNSMSDLPIHRFFNKWMEENQLELDAKYYDYTKVLAYTKKNKDVHYTFSAAEDNRSDVMEAMALGLNIAVVVRDKSYDNSYGYNIVDGDITDARFLDPANSIVLLQGKGEAKSSDSDFIFNNLKDFITWLQR